MTYKIALLAVVVVAISYLWEHLFIETSYDFTFGGSYPQGLFLSSDPDSLTPEGSWRHVGVFSLSGYQNVPKHQRIVWR